MPGMSKYLKQFGKPATSSKKSDVIVKTVTRKEINDLKRSMEPIIEQNKRERGEATPLIESYKNEQISTIKVKKLTR